MFLQTAFRNKLSVEQIEEVLDGLVERVGEAKFASVFPLALIITSYPKCDFSINSLNIYFRYLTSPRFAHRFQWAITEPFNLIQIAAFNAPHLIPSLAALGFVFDKAAIERKFFKAKNLKYYEYFIFSLSNTPFAIDIQNVDVDNSIVNISTNFDRLALVYVRSLQLARMVDNMFI